MGLTYALGISVLVVQLGVSVVLLRVKWSLSLDSFACFETLLSYWVASFSLNRRGCA